MPPSSLAGKRVVVTRAAHQAPELCRVLKEHGARPLVYPCIDIVPPQDVSLLDLALVSAARGMFDWLALTSTNSVDAVAQRLGALGIDKTTLQTLPTAAIGPATAAAAVKHLGVEVDVVPDEYVAEALAEAMRPKPGVTILLPRASEVRPALVDHLERAGARVVAVAAYRTIVGQGGVCLPPLLDADRVAAVTLTSSSTARYFVQRLQADGGQLQSLEKVCIACIGPITAGSARQAGLDVQVTAGEYTIRGLVRALEAHYSQESR